MTADGVAVTELRYRTDHRATLASGRRRPHPIGNRSLPPGSGCDVIRMCSVRLERFIAGPQKPMARR